MSSWALAALLMISGVMTPALPSDRDLERLLGEGRAALEQGEAARAIRVLEQARTVSPESATACFLLGRAYAAGGRNSLALGLLEEAGRRDEQQLGAASVAEAARVRTRWATIELRHAVELFEADRWDAARARYLDTFRIAGDDDARLRDDARRGYVRSSARQLAVKTVAGLTKEKPVVVLEPFAFRRRGAIESVAELFRTELIQTLKELGAQVSVKDSTDRGDVRIRGAMGQRLVVSSSRPGSAAIIARVAVEILAHRASDWDRIRRAPIAVRLRLKGHRLTPGRPTDFPILEGATVVAGDRVRIWVTPTEDSYVYVIHFNSQGEAKLLSHEEDFNPVSANEQRVLPRTPPGQRTNDYVVDGEPGEETIYVAVSLRPLDDLEPLLEAITARGEAGRAASARVASLMAEKSEATRVDEVRGKGHLELIQGRGAVVRYITFRHD